MRLGTPLAACALLLMAAQVGHAQQPAAIFGRVVDVEGAPVAGAVVRVEAYKVGASTNEDGFYRLIVPGTRIRPGARVEITAWRRDFKAVSRTLTLNPGADVGLNFQVQPAEEKPEPIEACCRRGP